MPGTEKGHFENQAAGNPRLSSYTFPKAVEVEVPVGRRLLPIIPYFAFRENFPTWKRLFSIYLFTEPPSNSGSDPPYKTDRSCTVVTMVGF
jgi:hypothetical protein